MALSGYSAAARGLNAGVRTGLMMGQAWNQRRTRKDTEAMLEWEAKIANYQPGDETPPTGGAIPVDGEQSGEFKAPGQGYSGNSLRDMVEQGRLAAAKVGDPQVYANFEGRMLDSMARGFQGHMKSALMNIDRDPTAAVESMVNASAYTLDGSTAQFNIVTGMDGTPVIVHQVEDPNTGEMSRTAMTKDMLSEMMLAEGGQEGYRFVAGMAGIGSTAAARNNAARDLAISVRKDDVTAHAAGTAYVKDVRTLISESMEVLTPKAGETEYERYDADSDTTITETIPGFAHIPSAIGAMSAMIEDTIMLNTDSPGGYLLRGGAEYKSKVGVDTVRNMFTELTENFAKGTGEPSASLTLFDNEDGTHTVRFNGQTLIVSSDAILQDAVGVANSIRREDGLAPLAGSREWDWINESSEEPIPAAGVGAT